MSGRRKNSHLVACVILMVLFLLALSAVEGNSGGGTNSEGRVGRALTVEEIEDVVAMRWATGTASRWDEEDWSACDLPGARVQESMLRCMVMRSNTRFLYMLRRGCTGVSAIASACKMEVK